MNSIRINFDICFSTAILQIKIGIAIRKTRMNINAVLNYA